MTELFSSSCKTEASNSFPSLTHFQESMCDILMDANVSEVFLVHAASFKVQVTTFIQMLHTTKIVLTLLEAIDCHDCNICFTAWGLIAM